MFRLISLYFCLAVVSSLLHIHKQTRNGLKASGLDCNPGKDSLRILP